MLEGKIIYRKMRKDCFSASVHPLMWWEPWEVQGFTLLSEKMVICQMLFQIPHSSNSVSRMF